MNIAADVWFLIENSQNDADLIRIHWKYAINIMYYDEGQAEIILNIRC